MAKTAAKAAGYMKSERLFNFGLKNVILCAILSDMKKGKLTQNNVHLKDHEYKTVKLLLENGYDVELIPPSKIKGLKNPDIVMNGVVWEMKSPEGKGKNTIKNTVQTGSHQSASLIIDLRRTSIADDAVKKEIEKQFKLSRRLRRMKIITKDEKILDLTK